MKKPVINNGTIYRALDELSPEEELQILQNAFHNTIEEQMEERLIKQELIKKVKELIQQKEETKELVEALIELKLVDQSICNDNDFMEINYIRERCALGLITEEERGEQIHEIIKDDYAKMYYIEYYCAMLKLLAIEDGSEYERCLQQAYQYKLKQLEEQKNSSVTYPKK